MTEEPDDRETNDEPSAAEKRDSRPPLVLAMAWTSRITTISLELVLPAMLGFWVDQRLGTRVLFLILGMMLGFVSALLSLLRLAKATSDNRPQD